MIVPRYVPGEWFAAVTDGTVGLLPPSASADLVARLWASLREDVGLGEHLQVLVSDGLAALPPFALVRLGDGRVQTVVRGPVVVEVSTADGPRVLSGADVTTWSEATVAGATAVTVRAADAVAGAADDLPVLSAVVRASVVGVVLDRDGVVDHEEPAAAEDASADDPTGAEPAPVRRRDQRAATPPSGVPVTEPVGAVEQVAAPAAQPTPAA
ncbi:hypothetical protein Q9R32_07690, partial [Actinotalea sp. AC32]|nr:hypothetical protein [Actinotalea sp. AC32]